MRPVERAIDRAFAAAGQAGPVGVAVSGGSDSTALLLCAHAWAAARSVELRVVTVDHGLRVEAATEAEGVARLSAKLGWSHQVVTLPPDADPRSAGRARIARHRAFARWASDHGIELLLLGHTSDDAAETVVMRAARLSAGATDLIALAQPQPLSLSPLWPEGRGLLLARPLLARSRAELRACLTAQAIGWADDPTNADPRRERTQARAWLAADPTRRQVALHLWRAGLRARRGLLRGLRTVSPTFQPDGSVEVRVTALPFLGARGLALLLAVASGSPQVPGLAEAQAVLTALARGEHSLTRAGVLLRRHGGHFRLTRDAGALAAGGATLAHGVWDGRFAVGTPPPGTHVAPPGLLDRLRSPVRASLKPYSPEVRATLPALWREGVCEGLAPRAPLTALRWRQLTWDGQGAAPLAKHSPSGLPQPH